MRKFALFLIIIVFALFSANVAGAVGSAFFTIDTEGKVYMLRMAWTADASGDVTEKTVTVPEGTVYAFAHDPENGVTDDYDVTVGMSYSLKIASAGTLRTVEWADILSGDGANLSNSEDGAVVSLTTPFSIPESTLTFTVDNAGNATSGTFILYIWRE